MIYYLYKLLDPVTRETKWIGVTRNPKQRVKTHAYYKGTRKCEWVRDLKNVGLSPIMEIISEYLSGHEAFKAEAKMLREHPAGLFNRLLGAHSDLTKKKLRDASIKDKGAMKRCALQAEASKKQVRDCFGTVFESTTHAGLFYGVSRSAIGKICNGNTRLRTVKGLTFQWVSQ